MDAIASMRLPLKMPDSLRQPDFSGGTARIAATEINAFTAC